MSELASFRLIWILGLFALTGSAEAANVYQTFDVPGAIGFGPVDAADPTSSNFYIRGDGADADFSGFGAFANPNGSLSYSISTNTPNPSTFFSFFTATASFNNFVISADSMTVTDFDISGTLVHTHGFTVGQVDLETNPHLVQYNLDQTMTTQWVGRQDFGGGFSVQIIYDSVGGYIRNEPGFDDATVTAFGMQNPAAAAYLNEVVANFAPVGWTHAGIWIVDQDYTVQNTFGTLASNLIGGHLSGYNVWYSVDPFIFGNPLEDPTPQDPVTPADLDQMIADGLFPDTAGLVLPGDTAVQIWDIELGSGNGSPLTVDFVYDETLLPVGFDEMLLRIAHYVDGAWEIPAGQIVDPVANTITVTLDNFSPFALTASPLDTDGDGVPNSVDNCTVIANPAQTDANADGIGNQCDPDIGRIGDQFGDCLVNFIDLDIFKDAFFSNPSSPSWNPEADFTGPAGMPDGQINFADLSRLKDFFFGAPGPASMACVPGT